MRTFYPRYSQESALQVDELNTSQHQITSLGFVPQTYEAIVAGAIVAAQRAHDNLAPGSLSLGNTTLLDTSINRSPTAYLANPESERSLYGHDTDKDFSLLRFDDASTGKPKGFLSFFAVHGTSLYNNNTLIVSPPFFHNLGVRSKLTP